MSAGIPASLATVGLGVLLFTTILAMAIVDCRRLVIPDRLNLLLATGGLGQVIVLGRPDFSEAILGAAIGFGALYTLATLFRHARGVDGLGFGDQKFAGAAGLWLGWQHIAPMLLIASIAGLAFIAIFSIRRKTIDRRYRLPFGPFLGFGMAVCWVGLVAIPS
jgi:leader peptidase (prepilin peptidase)/N-methyltransferase